MFDFDYWCLWAEARCREEQSSRIIVEFSRGKPSAKRGAVVNFKTEQKLMQLAFWETGEADFYDLALPTERDIVLFVGRILDDSLFEPTFRACLNAATQNPSPWEG